ARSFLILRGRAIREKQRTMASSLGRRRHNGSISKRRRRSRRSRVALVAQVADDTAVLHLAGLLRAVAHLTVLAVALGPHAVRGDAAGGEGGHDSVRSVFWTR